MERTVSISAAAGPEDIAAAGALFADYAAALPIDLAYQDFNAELAGLPGKYAPPGGALLLARGAGGEALGCVGLRRLDSLACELKRLYIAPGARGLGLGRSLTEAAIDQARRLGYARLRLDTLPTMRAALALYEQLGFQACPPYYGPTPEGTIFMELDL